MARKGLLGKRLTRGFQKAPALPARAAGSVIVLAWALLLALGVLWGVSSGVALAQLSRHQADLMEDLPANLMNVLAVDCR
jgi:hypothetical protein